MALELTCTRCGDPIADTTLSAQYCSERCFLEVQHVLDNWNRPCEQCGQQIDDGRTTAPTICAPFCSTACWGAAYSASNRGVMVIECDRHKPSRTAARFEWEVLRGHMIEGIPAKRLSNQWVLDTSWHRRNYGPDFIESGRLCAQGHSMEITAKGGRAYEAFCPDCNERVTYDGGVLMFNKPRLGRLESEAREDRFIIRCQGCTDLGIDVAKMRACLNRAFELGQHKIQLRDLSDLVRNRR